MLEGAVLFVGLGFQHLVFEFRDLLLLHLDVAFQTLAVLLVSSERGAVSLQLALVTLELSFDFSDVLGKG